MKQHITLKQFNELNEKGKINYGKWCLSRDHQDKEWCERLKRSFPPDSLPLLLSIGEMIEFLDERWKDVFFYHNDMSGKENFCNALWQPTKEILEK